VVFAVSHGSSQANVYTSKVRPSFLPKKESFSYRWKPNVYKLNIDLLRTCGQVTLFYFSFFLKKINEIIYLKDGFFCIKAKFANLVVIQLRDG
jgi:hypothetical protein